MRKHALNLGSLIGEEIYIDAHNECKYDSFCDREEDERSMYVIRLKNSAMFLDEDGGYTPTALDANSFDDFSEAKTFASDDEEVVEIDTEGNVIWTE